MPKLAVALSSDRVRFLIYGGVPGGRDIVHKTIVKWPGWRRLKARGRVPDHPGALGVGAICSLYAAPVSPVTAGQLASYTEGIAWDDTAYAAAVDAIKSLELSKAALASKPTLNAPTDRNPLIHQAQAVHAARYLGERLLLADDMGLGKTSTALWIVWRAFKAPPRTLVLCPASVKFNWQREAWTTLGRDTWITVIDGLPKKRADQMADIRHRNKSCAGCAPGDNNSGIVIINYDLLKGLSDDHLTILREWVDDGALLLDESYYLKSRASQRSKLVREHFAPAEGGARCRIGISGTPVRNEIDDLYFQVELIRPGTWTSYTDFCDRYMDYAITKMNLPAKDGKKKKRIIRKPLGGKNKDKLNAIMNTLQIRRKKDVIEGLPPKTYTYPELRLDGPFLKMYRAMREWALLELGELTGDALVFSPQAQGAAQAVMRCEQISQGFVGGVPDHVMAHSSAKLFRQYAHKILNRKHELIFPESPKMAWLLETIELLWGQGDRPVIFSRFNGPLVWLRHHFEDDSIMMHGGQTSAMKEEVVQRFEAGEHRLFLGQVSIAIGYNLVSSQDVLFLSRHHAPAVNAQAADRLHRIGQKGTVNIQIPIVTNTIEKLIHQKLARKEGDAGEVLKDLTVKELMEAL